MQLKKSLVVFGGNGFLGTAICKYAVSLGLYVKSISRSGKPLKTEAWQSSVEYLTGDALETSSYISHIPTTSGIIHSIGTYFESGFYLRTQGVTKGSYQQTNRDTAYRICETIENKSIPFVFISAAKGLFLFPDYLSTKRDVEEYLISKKDIIPNSILRPGLMYEENNKNLKHIASVIKIFNYPEKFLKEYNQE